MTQKPNPAAPALPHLLNILVVEDSPYDAELLLQELRRAGLNVRMDVAKTAVEVVAFLLGGSYDLVLSDFNLRGWTGLDALQLLRERQSDVPFILVTGSLGEEKAAECIKLGAADFVLKDRLSRLPHAIARALEEKRLREQQLASDEALRRSEAEYRSLVKGAPYGIYLCTPDGALLMVNPALVAMLGYESESQVLALNLATDVYLTPEELSQLIQGLSSTGEFQGFEARWKRKDGKPITVRLSGRPVHNEGEGQHFAVMVEDITEQRLLEQQFRQAQKMEAIGQLAGGVAHDFNNLLMVIGGFTEMVGNAGPANEKQRHYLEEVLKATRRAAGLTQQLLAFSRKQVLAPSVLDLKAVANDFGKMLPPLIGEHIEVRLLTKAQNSKVEADRGQIEQILMNLAVNARDAMPKGGTLVIEVADAVLDQDYVSSNYTIPAGSYVLLAVSDNGAGMTRDILEHIFEPFFTTKELGKGTGLGLSTVYGIVKQSGGFISAYSEPGVGTTFKIYLPCAEEPAAPPPAEPEPPAAGGSETILLVEDENSVRIAAREFLKMKGYAVLEAADGTEGLRLHSQHTGRIHLLITDFVMPGGTGRELAEKLQRRDKQLRVLYISGYTGGSVSSMAGLDAGASFLQKPFALESLARTVRSVLDAAPQGASTG